ncbi:serine hydrolase domain-containing protein [Alteromonas facilis]|uniref:serine hydrolase domain-containing protein n=1 Tax=Alteromonas facilis TaxID=2048004 RepID=UPI001F0CBAFB|nr:serine hydrolase domain-containing protein [Alteromonas facilis]
MSVVIACPASAQQAPSWFTAYSADVKERAGQLNIPGYAMVFYQQGQSPYIVTQGKTHRRGQAIDKDTVFRMASVSKTFTGVLMAKLVSQNQLSWNTELTQLVNQPGFKTSNTDKIRLEHLIGQSSGFMPNAYDNLIEADYPVKRVLGQLADLKPLCQPGDCYTYQNALFGTLEHYFSTQNTSYHRQLQTHLFSPLAMETASAGKGALMGSERWARPHIAIAKDRWREGVVENNYYRFAPAAGVNASIQDLLIYLQAMLIEYPDIVSDAVVRDVSTPRVRTTRELSRRGWREHLNDAHYGLGWRVYDFDGHRLVYHGGWVKGYRADVSFSPETGAAYAMLMNAESNLINYTTAEFWAAYFKHAEPQKVAVASSP